MRRVMVFYPPGMLYQRGEDRCQANVEDSTSSAPRAANDLGYASSTLKAVGFDVFLKDYQNEGLAFSDLVLDFGQYAPDAIMISTTNGTVFSDIEVVNHLRALRPATVVVLKGAVFFSATGEMLRQLDLGNVDYLIGGESDFALADLLDAHYNGTKRAEDVRGIFYRRDGQFVPTDFETWERDLDSLPFPDRDAMDNSLYVRPDTGAPMATISTSRGCPSTCTYCLTPIISGRKVRFRSPENVFAEISECYTDHGIREFFFKSDTFTINKRWVMELCDLIDRSPLSGRISWVANSRVKPIDRETLQRMHDVGCWLIAFGFETGSEETLTRIQKGATLDDALRANRYAREAGLKVFGFYMIGFPWESPAHLEETRQFMFDIDADFVELHIAIPYYGTELYRQAETQGLLEGSPLGKDYFSPSMKGTEHLTAEELSTFRKKVLLSYHLRPSYIVRKLVAAGFSPRILANYARYGLKLVSKSLA